MLHILAMVLLTIGKIILILLAVILVLLCCILFVPIRYGGSVKKDEQTLTAGAHGSWLLHLLRFSYAYPEPGVFRLKLLWFTLFSTGEEETQEKDKAETPAKKETPAKEETTAKEETPAKEETTAKEETSAKEEAVAIEETPARQEPGEKGQPDDEEKTAEKQEKKPFRQLHHAAYTFRQFCAKMKKRLRFLEQCRDYLEQDQMQQMITFCKKQLSYLLRKLKPDQLSGSIHFGMEDPSDTGQVMAVYGVLYPLLGGCMSVDPDFERELIEADVVLKGKIRLYAPAFVALKALCSPNCHRVVRELKRRQNQWRKLNHE